MNFLGLFLGWLFPQLDVAQALALLNSQEDIAGFLRREVGLQGDPVVRWLKKMTKVSVRIEGNNVFYDDGFTTETYLPIRVGRFRHELRLGYYAPVAAPIVTKRMLIVGLVVVLLGLLAVLLLPATLPEWRYS